MAWLGRLRPRGIILADLAGYVADALSAEGMGAKADLLDAIAERFNEEVSAPSSERMGGSGSEVS